MLNQNTNLGAKCAAYTIIYTPSIECVGVIKSNDHPIMVTISVNNYIGELKPYIVQEKM